MLPTYNHTTSLPSTNDDEDSTTTNTAERSDQILLLIVNTVVSRCTQARSLTTPLVRLEPIRTELQGAVHHSRDLGANAPRMSSCLELISAIDDLLQATNRVDRCAQRAESEAKHTLSVCLGINIDEYTQKILAAQLNNGGNTASGNGNGNGTASNGNENSSRSSLTSTLDRLTGRVTPEPATRTSGGGGGLFSRSVHVRKQSSSDATSRGQRVSPHHSTDNSNSALRHRTPPPGRNAAMLRKLSIDKLSLDRVRNGAGFLASSPGSSTTGTSMATTSTRAEVITPLNSNSNSNSHHARTGMTPRVVSPSRMVSPVRSASLRNMSPNPARAPIQHQYPSTPRDRDSAGNANHGHDRSGSAGRNGPPKSISRSTSTTATPRGTHARSPSLRGPSRTTTDPQQQQQQQHQQTPRAMSPGMGPRSSGGSNGGQTAATSTGSNGPTNRSPPENHLTLASSPTSLHKRMLRLSENASMAPHTTTTTTTSNGATTPNNERALSPTNSPHSRPHSPATRPLSRGSGGTVLAPGQRSVSATRQAGATTGGGSKSPGRPREPPSSPKAVTPDKRRGSGSSGVRRAIVGPGSPKTPNATPNTTATSPPHPIVRTQTPHAKNPPLASNTTTSTSTGTHDHVPPIPSLTTTLSDLLALTNHNQQQQYHQHQQQQNTIPAPVPARDIYSPSPPPPPDVDYVLNPPSHRNPQTPQPHNARKTASNVSQGGPAPPDYDDDIPPPPNDDYPEPPVDDDDPIAPPPPPSPRELIPHPHPIKNYDPTPPGVGDLSLALGTVLEGDGSSPPPPPPSNLFEQLRFSMSTSRLKLVQSVPQENIAAGGGVVLPPEHSNHGGGGGGGNGHGVVIGGTVSHQSATPSVARTPTQTEIDEMMRRPSRPHKGNTAKLVGMYQVS